MPNTELVTTSAVAKRLRKTTRTITRWADKGELAWVQKLDGLRGAYLFSEAEVARKERELGLSEKAAS